MSKHFETPDSDSVSTSEEKNSGLREWMELMAPVSGVEDVVVGREMKVTWLEAAKKASNKLRQAGESHGPHRG